MPSKVGLFMDVSNLYYSVKRNHPGYTLDYTQYYNYASDLGEVVLAIAYGAKMRRSSDRFIRKLRHIGFRTKYKRVKCYSDARKANWDVGITVDIMKAIESLDIIVLGSADGDFVPIVKHAVEKGKVVLVLAAEISSDYNNVATVCTEIPRSMLRKAETNDESDSKNQTD